MTKTKYGLIMGAFILTFGMGAFAYGYDSGDASNSSMVPDMRQKLADIHQKMADCLRSDKMENTCYQEMKKSCHDQMGKAGCHMRDKHNY